jgi:ATP-dependent HslUV protease ATP-binding subunit HslU
MLFIAAGAFHVSRVEDLIPELQGRFPVQVTLKPLTKEDFRQILTQPENALIKQYRALLKVDETTVDFTDDALDAIADAAVVANDLSENIGARRLHTLLELLVEDIAYEADPNEPKAITIDSAYVQEKMKDVFSQKDLSKYII